jgi:hypothetical protein
MSESESVWSVRIAGSGSRAGRGEGQRRAGVRTLTLAAVLIQCRNPRIRRDLEDR